MRYVLTILVCLHMLAPAISNAQDVLKDPLKYSLRDYGLVLAVALLGGLVSWYAKVRRGEIPGYSVMQLIGELATSAFAGLIAFWLCEWANFPQLLTVAMVAISGHMGTAAIQQFEKLAARKFGESQEQKP